MEGAVTFGFGFVYLVLVVAVFVCLAAVVEGRGGAVFVGRAAAADGAVELSLDGNDPDDEDDAPDEEEDEVDGEGWE